MKRSVAALEVVWAAALLLIGHSEPARAQGRSIFGAEGRPLTEGRIFEIASSDLDADGRPDIVVSDFLAPARVLFNDARQAFSRVLVLTDSAETATEGHGVAVADFNGDKTPDLLLVYNGNPSRLLFGDGKGGFADSGQAIGEPGLNGVSAGAADVDGDGDMDALISYYQQPDRVYLNDGRGALTAGPAFEGNAVLGDADGDGDPDALCVPGGGEGPVSIWLNARGRFVRQEKTLDVDAGLAALKLIDLDGDRDLDLVVLGRTVPSILFENDGKGAFLRLEQKLDSGSRLTSGDVDLDGDIDLVLGSAVYINAGRGRFEKSQPFELGDLPTALQLVDVDGDGDLDLLANHGSRQQGRTELRLFINTLRAPKG